MVYVTQHALLTGMRSVPQAVSPAVQVARRASWEAGLGSDTGEMALRGLSTVLSRGFEARDECLHCLQTVVIRLEALLVTKGLAHGALPLLFFGGDENFLNFFSLAVIRVK